MWEGTSVPVRVISEVAGVSSATIYEYARARGWRPRPVVGRAVCGAAVGRRVSQEIRILAATPLGPARAQNQKHSLTAEEVEEVRRLWEDTPASSGQIARRFAHRGLTRGMVVGMAARRGWTSYNDPRPPLRPLATTMDRLAALNASMDALLAQSAGGEGATS